MSDKQYFGVMLALGAIASIIILVMKGVIP